MHPRDHFALLCFFASIGCADTYDAQRGARPAPAGHYRLVARVGVEGRLLSSEPIDVIRP